jgi:ribulose kinase
MRIISITATASALALGVALIGPVAPAMAAGTMPDQGTDMQQSQPSGTQPMGASPQSAQQQQQTNPDLKKWTAPPPNNQQQ